MMAIYESAAGRCSSAAIPCANCDRVTSWGEPTRLQLVELLIQRTPVAALGAQNNVIISSLIN